MMFTLKPNNEMSEYTNIPDSQDFYSCSELPFIEDQLRLRREQVNAAVEVVGNDHKKIEEFLKTKYRA